MLASLDTPRCIEGYPACVKIFQIHSDGLGLSARMFKAFLIVTVFTLTGIQVTLGRECCNTGFNHYTWCTTYCCKPTYYSSSVFNHCCSTYSDKAWFTASSSKCSSFFEENVWVPILIALGCLGVVVGIIVCCVCCMKGCMANNRTGTVVSNPGQPPNTGVMMMNTTMVQQAAGHYQQPYAYGGQPMQSGGYMQPGQAVYPPGYIGPSLAGPSSHPPPYTNPDTEKAGGALPN